MNTVWQESFNYSNKTTSAIKDGVTWNCYVENGSAQWANKNTCSVNNSLLRFKNDSGGDYVWETSAIDISSYSSVEITIDLVSSKKVEGDESIEFFYSLNGGISYSPFDINPTHSGAVSTTIVASQTIVSGTNVQLMVRGVNFDWNDEYRFDNILVFNQPSSVTFCDSYGNETWETSITLVNFNTINNSSAKPSGYSDYTTQLTDVIVGSSYDLTVNLNTDGNYLVEAMAWVDWNQNNRFDDAGESYNLGSVQDSPNGATSGSPYSINVPVDAVIGNTRMRVAAKYNNHPSECETDFDGEVEDYTLNVVNSVPKITSFTPVNACSNSSQVVTITGTNFTGATAVSFNGVAALSFTVNSATQINATLPVSATSGALSVTSPDGTGTSTQSFTVNPLPAAAGNITGTDIVLPGDTKSYVCAAITDATSYEWAITGDGVSITNNGTQADITFADDASSGDRILTVKGVNSCGSGAVSSSYIIFVRPSYFCQTTIVNWDFDSPDLNGLDWKGYSTVNGWSSSLNNIEIWRDGFMGITTPDGGQFCELNSTGVNEMWQNVNTVPGVRMRWSIAYRYRNSSSESIRLKIGAVGALSNIADISNNNGDGWVTHSGFYTVPAGQTTTQFRIATLNPSGSSGNLIDNIQFYSIETDVEGPEFDLPADADGDGYVVSECVDATSLVVNNIAVTNLTDNCTPVANVLIEYQVTNQPSPSSAEIILVNFGDDPAGLATSSDASGYAFPIGVNTVTYQVSDEAGNLTEKSFVVYIKRTPKPVGIFFE